MIAIIIPLVGLLYFFGIPIWAIWAWTQNEKKRTSARKMKLVGESTPEQQRQMDEWKRATERSSTLSNIGVFFNFLLIFTGLIAGRDMITGQVTFVALLTTGMTFIALGRMKRKHAKETYAALQVSLNPSSYKPL